MKKISCLLISIVLIGLLLVSFVACNNNQEDSITLRFTAPEGTPALAMLTLATEDKNISSYDVNYEVVSPSNIASEMSSNKSDIIIMPVNAGANLIRMGADYKLVSVAVYGSLYIVGYGDKGTNLSIEDLKGKKIACIGQTGVPGLIFRYVMNKNNVELITSGEPTQDQVFVEYVADGAAAKVRLAGGQVDFALVGEPAATAFKSALNCTSEMDMQKMYSSCDSNNGNSFPQAGLFVKSTLASDEKFMTSLFEELKSNKEYISSNAASVKDLAKNLYESAVFPPASISRCAVDGSSLLDTDKDEIINFLKNVMPKDSSKNTIDWDAAKGLIF